MTTQCLRCYFYPHSTVKGTGVQKGVWPDWGHTPDKREGGIRTQICLISKSSWVCEELLKRALALTEWAGVQLYLPYAWAGDSGPPNKCLLESERIIPAGRSYCVLKAALQSSGLEERRQNSQSPLSRVCLYSCPTQVQEEYGIGLSACRKAGSWTVWLIPQLSCGGRASSEAHQCQEQSLRE